MMADKKNPTTYSVGITLSRVILIPVIIVFSSLNWDYLAAFFFLIASLTDFLDGYVARKRNEVTEFGAFFDPIADKLLVVSMMVITIPIMNSQLYLYGILLYIVREFIVSSFREWLAIKHKGMHLNVIYAAKAKTFFQMMMLLTALLVQVQPGLLSVVYLFMAIGLLLSYFSLFQYLKKIRTVLTF